MPSPDLPKGKRLESAGLSGAVSRLTRGADRHLTRAEKLLVIRQISTDAQVLGYVLGGVLAGEHPEYAAEDAEAAGLLREVGADEGEAERRAAWIREKRARRHGGFQL